MPEDGEHEFCDTCGCCVTCVPEGCGACPGCYYSDGSWPPDDALDSSGGPNAETVPTLRTLGSSDD